MNFDLLPCFFCKSQNFLFFFAFPKCQNFKLCPSPLFVFFGWPEQLVQARPAVFFRMCVPVPDFLRDVRWNPIFGVDRASVG